MIRRGYLVKNEEGYYGIVKWHNAEIAAVLLSNGRTAECEIQTLAAMPVREGVGEAASFLELVEALDTVERLQL